MPDRYATFCALAAAAAATPCLPCQSLLQQHHEVLLAAGEPAPGIPGKTAYGNGGSGFATPAIDQDGTVVFQTRLFPSGVDDRAIYVGRSRADLRLVAQSGQQAPGLPAGVLLRSSSTVSGAALENDPQISGLGGIVCFGSRLYDPSNPANTPNTADTALFWGQPGALQVLVREGDQVPGLPNGVTFGDQQWFTRFDKLASDGRVVLQCGLGGVVSSADDAVMVLGTPGNLTVVAREGAPVNIGGLTWATVTGSYLSNTAQINGNGEILLDCRFGGSANQFDDRALAVWSPTSGVSILSREGDLAVGSSSASAVLIGNPGRSGNSWDDTGNTLFVWSISDGGANITSSNDTIVYYGSAAGITKVFQEGDATGLPGGETWGDAVNDSLVSSAAGTIALISRLRDANGTPLPSTQDAALFVGTPGNLQPIVIEGTTIGAIPPSSNGPWICGSVNGSVNMNARGQVLFLQDASDGVDSIVFLLLWDPLLGLQLVRDDSETYTTPVGTGQAWGGFGYGGNESGGDGSPSWFNNAGDFVINESIDNGVFGAIVRGHSGSLIGTPATIPAAGGSHALAIDCGPSHQGELYLVVGTLSGTRPGFPSPFGPVTVPLNPDWWLDVSLGYANTAIYPNTLGLLDGNGRVAGGAAFVLPAAIPALAGQTLHHVVVTFDAAFVNTLATEPAAVKFL